jgi:hypothetical protein
MGYGVLNYEYGFHVTENLYFKRMDDGNVLMTKVIVDPDGATLYTIQQMIDKNIWASIVASVSKRGEAHDRFYHALEFHQE